MVVVQPGQQGPTRPVHHRFVRVAVDRTEGGACFFSTKATMPYFTPTRQPERPSTSTSSKISEASLAGGLLTGSRW